MLIAPSAMVRALVELVSGDEFGGNVAQTLWAVAIAMGLSVVGGFAIGATVNIAFRWSGGSRLQSHRVGFLVGTGAGLQKEYLDGYTNANNKALGFAPTHSVEAGDALATIAGAYLGSWCVQYVWK